MSQQLEIIEIGSRAREFLALQVADNQLGLVATMAESYADALFPPDYGLGPVKPWLRGVTNNLVPAGFIMCADPTDRQIDPWIWRLLVDKRHQGIGIGSLAVEAAISRYKELACKRLLVSWQPGVNSPAGFYQRRGFKETGEFTGDEAIAELIL